MNTVGHTVKRCVPIGPWRFTSTEKDVMRLLIGAGYFSGSRIAEIMECHLSTVVAYRKRFRK